MRANLFAAALILALPGAALAQTTGPIPYSKLGYGLARAPDGTVNTLGTVKPFSANHTVTSADMGAVLALTGTGTLTFPTISSTVFANGMSMCWINEGSGFWSFTSSGPTLNGIQGGAYPGMSGCLTSDGTNLHASPVNQSLVTATAPGLAPAFPNNTTTFLRGDGTYATPAGGVTPGGTSGQIQTNNGSGGLNGLALVPVASGGTGTASPGLVAGTNVTISGTWPNQTVNSSGGGGGGTVYPSAPPYALTHVSGSCRPTTDSTAVATLYWTPCQGTVVALYNGSAWTQLTPGEISLSLTGIVASGSNYDVFVYNNAGTATLELSAAWTNNTTRADALAAQDGITVKSSDHTRLWIGAIRGTASGQTSETSGGATVRTGGKRFIFNAYQRRRRTMSVWDSGNWNNTNTAWHQWDPANATSAPTNCIEWLQGDLGLSVVANAAGSAYQAGTANLTSPQLGIGINSITAPSGFRSAGAVVGGSGGNSVVTASYTYPTPTVAVVTPNNVTLGYNYACVLEKAGQAVGPSAVTSYFNGDNTSTDGQQNGMTVTLD